MTKITVDKDLIEQALDTIGYYASVCGEDEQETPAKRTQKALRAALAEPAVQQCGYDETTGNCTKNPCCYTSPPPPAEVPLLTTDEYTTLAHRIASKYAHRSDPQHIAYTFLPHTLEQFAREIERAVRQNAGLV